MDKHEALKIIAVLTVAYPNTFKKLTDGEIGTMATLWQTMFASDEYREVEAAVQSFIATDEKGFMPPIGAIKERLSRLRAGPDGEMTEQEAWSLVNKALRNGIYGYEKEFAALPEAIQRSIGSSIMLHEWAQMDIETVNSVVSSNFMRSYRARAARILELQKLPPDVKEFFGAVGEAMKLPEARKPEPEAQSLEPGEPVAPPDWWKGAREKYDAASVQRQVDAVKERIGAIFGGAQL